MYNQLLFQTVVICCSSLLDAGKLQFQTKDAGSVLGPTVFLSGNWCQSGHRAQLCRRVCTPLRSGVTPSAASPLARWARADKDPHRNHQPSCLSAGKHISTLHFHNFSHPLLWLLGDSLSSSSLEESPKANRRKLLTYLNIQHILSL